MLDRGDLKEVDWDELKLSELKGRIINGKMLKKKKKTEFNTFEKCFHFNLSQYICRFFKE